MNNKKNVLFLIIVFAALIIGATFLYNNLITNYKVDSLITKKDTEEFVENTSTENSTNTYVDQSQTDNNNENTSETTPSETSENETIEFTKAPEFTVYNLENKSVNLSDFFGKPIIINFWASWCGPCQMEMPDFNEAYINYKDNIEFLMVNMTDGSRETMEKASSFIEEKNYSFPVYYDTEYSAAITYSVTSLPTTYFIDSDGNLIAHAKGAINSDILQKGIDMIYK